MANTRSFRPKSSASDEVVSSTAVNVDQFIGEPVQPAARSNDLPEQTSAPAGQSSPPYSGGQSSYEGNVGGRYRDEGYDRGYSSGRDVPTEDVSGYLDIMPEG